MTETQLSQIVDSLSVLMLIFFIYSTIGWIWECSLFLVKEKKFINRGFLTGPYIPIYGCGATIIFACLKNFSEYPTIIIFIMGMTFATVLEYLTAVIMENIFKVRLWEYDDMPLNFQGRICVPASLFWGLAGIVVVRYSTPFFIKEIGLMYRDVRIIFTSCYFSIFALDVVISFASMFNLKAKIKNIKEIEQKLIPNFEKLQEHIPGAIKENYLKNIYKLSNISINTLSIKRISKAFPKMKFKSETDNQIFLKIKEASKKNKKKSNK